jgi:hypothetical protein
MNLSTKSGQAQRAAEGANEADGPFSDTVSAVKRFFHGVIGVVIGINGRRCFATV